MNSREIEESIDRVCDEYEAVMSKGDLPVIADYLEKIDSQHRSKLFYELILLEQEILENPIYEKRLAAHLEEFPEYEITINAEEIPDDSRSDGRPFSPQRSSREKPIEQPKQIGPYKLLQKIGEGGMGEVWMAQQQSPVKRKVALKIIKSGWDSSDVIGRFEIERQFLAIMNHPGIASIFDAGETEFGQPYFAMELVKGLSLTEYCDAHQLSLESRLKLFVKICDAVQHAHQKGIIHRDLKPGNILVAEYDGHPQPKVIDFGLSKALDPSQKFTDKSLFTEYGKVLGTFRYMSPEQAGLDSMDIDTRSDVYALGVILHELLTGITPIDPDQLLGKALGGILQLIRDQESPVPSNRLSTTSKDLLSSITENRKTNLQTLSSILRGDLDWIVMKALENERKRRYESVGALADDIRRHLEKKTVSARPPSIAYKVEKLFKRNRLAFIATTIVLITMVLASVVSTIMAIKAETARSEERETRLESVIQLANSTMLQAFTARDTTYSIQKSELLFLRAAELFHSVGDEKRSSEALMAAASLPNVTAIQHKSVVVGSALSPNGKYGLTWSKDGEFMLWDSSTGEIFGKSQHATPVMGGMFSHDGENVLSWGGTEAKLWNISNRKTAQRFSHTTEIKTASFGKNGNSVATVSMGEIRLWDIGEAEPRLIVPFEFKSVSKVAFSPTGEHIIVSCDYLGDGVSHLFNVSDGEFIHTFPHATQARFSKDGRKIVCTNFNSPACIYSLDSLEKIHTSKYAMFEMKSDFNAVIFWNDRGEMEHWSLTEPCEKVRDYDLNSKSILSINNQSVRQFFNTAELKFSGQTIAFRSTARSNEVILWDTEDNVPIQIIRASSRVVSSQLLQEGRQLLLAYENGTSEIWDVAFGKLIRVFREESGAQKRSNVPMLYLPYQPVVARNQDKLLTFDTNGRATCWDIKRSRLLWQHKRGSAAVLKPLPSMNPNGTQVVSVDEFGVPNLFYLDGSNRKEKLVDDLIKEGVIEKVPNYSHFDTKTEFTDTSNVVVFKSFPPTVWSTKPKLQLKCLLKNQKGEMLMTPRFDVDAYNDSILLDIPPSKRPGGDPKIRIEKTITGGDVSSDKKRFIMWNSAESPTFWVYRPLVSKDPDHHYNFPASERATIQSAKFSASGDLVAVSLEGGAVWLFDLDKERVLQKFENILSSKSFIFVANGMLLLNADYLGLWDYKTSEYLHKFRIESDQIENFEVNQAGTRLAMWGQRGDVLRILKLKTGTILREFKFRDLLKGVMFSNDGLQILCWFARGGMKWFNLESGEAIQFFKNSTKVNSVKYLQKENQWVTSHPDGIVNLWSMYWSEPVSRYYRSNGVELVDVSQDEKRILATDHDRVNFMLELPDISSSQVDEIVREAKSRLSAYIDPETGRFRSALRRDSLPK